MLNGLCGAGEKDSVFVLESHAPYWSLHKIDALGNLKKEEKEQRELYIKRQETKGIR